MPQHLPQRQNQPLSRLILRLIRRLLDHLKGLEELPQFVRRVSQARVRERVGGQEVAELVVKLRLRERH
jgi:hypothetical protein